MNQDSKFISKLVLCIGVASMIGYLTAMFDILIDSILWLIIKFGILFLCFYLPLKVFPEIRESFTSQKG